jgi:3-methylcrotonyl-CoA carboxylase alpha subunit
MNLSDTISSLLIANRGEIACRIIRTAKRLGIRTIAVYSQVDAKAMHVALADDAVCIGPAQAGLSYLNIESIIKAARQTGARAVHPGYGFLSERPDFAKACVDEGLIFVGPPASAMQAMGLKDAAKSLVARAGVPIVPGYLGENQDDATLQVNADRIGYPLLIKAVAGGGGKGMKRVDDPAEFKAALASAKREAQAAFGNDRVLLEKYILAPRHIEMQIFADTHGNCIHLFERDCSLQRRHQKVIEEAPAPDMPAHVREAMGIAAIRAAQSVGYVGAGTVEFIVDGTRPLDVDTFYFMEMNTRLQVEHPVTEMITDVDLVEWQLRIAANESLPLTQSDLHIHGHAIEARLYAEDPQMGFLPSTGRLEALNWPEGAGIRVDNGVRCGDEISPYYDPMLAKIIAHGPTREDALARLSHALENTWTLGPTTNAPFLKALIDHPDFRARACDTGFIATHLEALNAVSTLSARETGVLACRGAVGLFFQDAPIQDAPIHSPWGMCDAFQLGPPRDQVVPIMMQDQFIYVSLKWSDNDLIVEALDQQLHVSKHHPLEAISDIPILYLFNAIALVFKGRVHRFSRPSIGSQKDTNMGSKEQNRHIVSPLQGRVTAIYVKDGDHVVQGQPLLVVEAMKMEYTLKATHDGVIETVCLHAQDLTRKGQTLAMYHA